MDDYRMVMWGGKWRRVPADATATEILSLKDKWEDDDRSVCADLLEEGAAQT